MASNIFNRLGPSSRETRSFYEQLRSQEDEPDLEHGAGLDEANLSENFNEFDAEDLTTGDSRLTLDSVAFDTHARESRKHGSRAAAQSRNPATAGSRWPVQDDEIDNDVPASLLVEPNEAGNVTILPEDRPAQKPSASQRPAAGPSRSRAQWEAATRQQRLHQDDLPAPTSRSHPQRILRGPMSGGAKEKALWRWVNTSNLDSFMRDVYDYYEGGGLWCILCSNALWLLETLFVAIFVAFLSQCVDYHKLSQSRSLNQIVVKQCTRKMSGVWNLGIWMYSFFFIWKSVQYFVEIRRLIYIRDFYIHLLDIPEQDMQTVSWQDIVARIMALRDQNPKTATNIPANLRRYIGSQSKERLDAHDIANRLMRKENYLISMINKDVLNLSLPLPFLQGRQLFSKTMEWYLHYCILDMVFNEFGQVHQDFLRSGKRGVLSQKLKQRLYFAGVLNLVFAPIMLVYVIIVYFFTNFQEFQRDPKSAASRRYTSLAEWKFREFNELPHIFYERLHMSFPFATRYLDQFPKRTTEDIARSVAFVSGAIGAVLAIGAMFDPENFLTFEITKDRTVLFYLGICGTVWGITRGMVSEEALVFNPEYALRNVIEYTHYMPDNWQGQLHSFEVKQEFAELYKMKVVIFVEEIMGIITTPLLLLLSLPKCSDQIVDFFREFTVHVDGLGYVCSFAVFDFQKGVGNTGQHDAQQDVREDYYSTKHGKMAASYYGFIDNYVINPRTGIPGHMPPGSRPAFHPPPAFPGLNSPTLAADMQTSHVGRTRSRMPGGPRGARGALPPPSPMASILLDPHHQPIAPNTIAKSLHRSRYPRGGFRGDSQIIEESLEIGHNTRLPEEESMYEPGGVLGESTWETSPGKGLSRENSAATTDEAEPGVLGLLYQMQQTQRNRRGGVV